VAVVVSGAFWEEYDPNTEDQTPEECDPKGDTPRGRAAHAFCSEVYLSKD
jgi:hypothetical protein